MDVESCYGKVHSASSPSSLDLNYRPNSRLRFKLTKPMGHLDCLCRSRKVSRKCDRRDLEQQVRVLRFFRPSLSIGFNSGSISGDLEQTFPHLWTHLNGETSESLRLSIACREVGRLAEIVAESPSNFYHSFRFSSNSESSPWRIKMHNRLKNLLLVI